MHPKIHKAGHLFVAVCTLVAASPSLAVDCATLHSEVAQLVCRDPELAARDRKLASVYTAAAVKARGSLLRRLRADQAGWIKGRNDCWKAKGQPTWITATWTESTVKGCVDAQYRIRTSELQATWLLLPRTTAYVCQNAPANELLASEFATDPPILRLERGDRSKLLWRIGDATTDRYEGQNVSVLREGAALKVEWLDTDSGHTDRLDCLPH